LTEPLSGAWKGVIQYSEMKVGDDVVIIGVGGIGLLCMMVARAAGAGRLIAIDSSPYAREQAMKLGATHAIPPENAKDAS
ncbi:MAG TPA: zinc-binding dehydrogenase, partial [Spirochaetales bacterium]|nr:zinc-binding dehydrogenase [Spirochaetales bacterium]